MTIANTVKDHNTDSEWHPENALRPDTPPLPTAAPRIVYFSASVNAFYLSDELVSHATAGNLPTDLTEVSPSVFSEFALALPPLGKTRAVNGSGMPTWVDEPALPDAVIAARNLDQRDALLRRAADKIAPLQDAADLGISTTTEAEALPAWKRYRVLLSRLDQQQGYPMEIAWPNPPRFDD